MGQKFGTVAEVKAESVRDVIQYLKANYDGVDKYLLDSTEKEIGFTIKMGDQYIDDDNELLLPLDKGDIIITPTPHGAKGVVKVIVGIILIIAAFMIPGLSVPIQAMLVGMGSSLVMQGIAEMMLPDPAVDNMEQNEAYIFQGSEQVLPEGFPVPVLYGELRVPGQPVTFDLENTSSMANNRQHSGGSITVTADGNGNYHKSPSTYASIQ